MAIVKKATINGRTLKRDCASLCPNRLCGYWADVDGNKIDKITFGSTVRFYIETYWAYNATIKIYIKSNVSIILNKPEEKIVEDTINKLIPGYFAMKKNYVEIKLKSFGDYKVLHGMKDFELFCDITEGFNNFYGFENVAKVKVVNVSIIFPLLKKPNNDISCIWGRNYYWAASQGNNQATYMSSRSNKRKHAGRDLYTDPYEKIVAIADGIVLNTGYFYAGTNQITIKHKTIDGREFVIRYGELAPSSIKVSTGTIVKQGEALGATGKLIGVNVISGHDIYMLHFEYFTDSKSILPLTELSNLPMQRRSDNSEPLGILKEGYKNTFK